MEYAIDRVRREICPSSGNRRRYAVLWHRRDCSGRCWEGRRSQFVVSAGIQQGFRLRRDQLAGSVIGERCAGERVEQLVVPSAEKSAAPHGSEAGQTSTRGTGSNAAIEP